MQRNIWWEAAATTRCRALQRLALLASNSVVLADNRFAEKRYGSGLCCVGISCICRQEQVLHLAASWGPPTYEEPWIYAVRLRFSIARTEAMPYLAPRSFAVLIRIVRDGVTYYT
ncbi:uncharacterized protein EMH_0066270 [Eimeria mitis]|uniref:Secreted protein n=1 Tax=Eimeria mitis TaxID=44415 RepID=U6K0Y0_9EIME|nr:uncharacterized protein EMH_0066270 [Eimeria mitis]CDJ31375.1 hypothetical protein EMH_0066270 [Eimeria mitis]